MLKAKEMSIRILFIAIAMTVSAVQADGHECYRVQSVSSIIRTPFEKPADGVLADKIDVIATPGEHEPASIVLFSKEDLSEVMLTSGDLVSESASIDASHVDVRIVKCWYQAGTAWRGLRIQPSIRILVPELLLKDDSLVKVDYEKRINYVRLDFEEGSRYVDMSRVNPQKQPGMLNSQFPVKDSATLKPFKLPAEHYKQIWFTFYVPRNTPAGLYKGLVKITSSEKLIGQLEVNLRVLPFRLADSGTYYDPDEPFVSSIYYKGILCTEKNLQKAGLRGWWKTEQQYRADLKNMLAHGVTNPHICQFEVDSSLETFAKILKMRQEIGMDNSTIYVHKQSNWGIGTNTDPKILQKAIDEIKQAKKVAENFGVKQLYIYAIDEAKGDKLTQQRKVWDAFHNQAGVKIYVAGFMSSVPTPFELCGDKLDLLINACVPKREFASQWHGNGHKIWCYGNPQGGVENPLEYRRNFGLVLWKARFDGASTFVYSQGYGHTWNDFDDRRYRDHNLIYPTVDGVIDTIAWEGYREAMDDIRYGTVLKQLIAKALSDSEKDAQKKSIAKEADKWLEDIDENSRNLDTVRMEIIRYILKLRR